MDREQKYGPTNTQPPIKKTVATTVPSEGQKHPLPHLRHTPPPSATAAQIINTRASPPKNKCACVERWGGGIQSSHRWTRSPNKAFSRPAEARFLQGSVSHTLPQLTTHLSSSSHIFPPPLFLSLSTCYSQTSRKRSTVFSGVQSVELFILHTVCCPQSRHRRMKDKKKEVSDE